MRSKVVWAMIGFMLALSMVLASCAKEVTTTPTAPSPTATTTKPTQANWWDKFGVPQYGGTIKYRQDRMELGIDPYVFNGGVNYAYETMIHFDWTLNRDIWSFKTLFVPKEYYVGELAESWEMTDSQTLTVHLREGIHWQNKEPVNGREFTAEDVQLHYDRILGTGSGFTKPSPFFIGWLSLLERVTAADKYTVVYKFKSPSILGIYQAFDIASMNWIEPPEIVKKEGGFDDWHNIAGTGPFILTEYTPSTSMTWSKNPDYWGYDERHPENQIPYVDQVKVLCIPDVATSLAALRTGQIDIMENVEWQQAQSLTKTNPELLQEPLPARGGGWTIALRCDRSPFTDIRVRKALQLAVNLKDIAEDYYGGTAEAIPCGHASPLFKGWVTPYDDWPQELKDEYSYNPEKAKQLLTEAGYPNGFHTNVWTSSTNDIQLLQVIKSYFMNVGVDMEIKAMDAATVDSLTRTGKHDQMVYYGGTALTHPPYVGIYHRASGMSENMCFNNDAVYDAIVKRFDNSSTEEEAKQAFKDADMRLLTQHWSVYSIPYNAYTIRQPSLQGYSGESIGFSARPYFARLWIKD
jgi:peptide/nickel transport system substrate-binding protein